MHSDTHILRSPSTSPAAYFLIALLSVLAYWRIWTVRDVISDDNAWMLAVYAIEGLDEFLNTGAVELRRIIMGNLTYWFFSLHRNTEFFYVVWHGIHSVTQIASPILLFLLIREMFPASSRLALFSAIALVAFPLDYTLPYATVTNYRLSLLLTLASLYFTSRSLSQPRLRILSLMVALATGVTSYFIFMEAAIALEPARVLLIIFHCYRSDQPGHTWIRRATLASSVYILVGIPFILEKLLYMPHGRYEGIYQFRPDFLLQSWELAKAAAHFLFLQWLVLLRYLDNATLFMYMVAFVSAAIMYATFNTASVYSETTRNIEYENPAKGAETKYVISFALALMLPPVLMFHAFNRPISWGINSYHATFSQPGYALLIGWVFARLLSSAAKARRTMAKLVPIALSIWVGAGIYFNNLNIEMFRQSWVEQTRFWNAFMARFPALPEQGTFFFDVKHNTLYPDPVYYYDFELMLNLLYAETTIPAEFRRYKAYTTAELTESQTDTGKGTLYASIIERRTHLGIDKLRPADFTVVYYRDGELFVNDEILTAYPGVPYQHWLINKKFLASPKIAHYPWRSKLEISPSH